MLVTFTWAFNSMGYIVGLGLHNITDFHSMVCQQPAEATEYRSAGAHSNCTAVHFLNQATPPSHAFFDETAGCETGSRPCTLNYGDSYDEKILFDRPRHTDVTYTA